MKIKALSLVLISQLSLFGALDSNESNESKLSSIDVVGNNDKFPTVVLKDTATAKTIINSEGLRRSMGAAGANIFKSLSMAPSVNVQSDDPYGLTGGSIRVRGYTEQELGVELDGIPLNDTGNFAVYPHEYADAENLYSVALTRGSVNIAAPFYSDIGGTIQLKTKLPQKKFAVQVNQSLGSYNFYKGFYRVDSGELSTGTRIFASYSHAQADKWKGPGKAPDYRDHVALGLSQDIGKSKIDVFYDFNTQLNYSYKYHQMNWTQAQDYKKYYTTDNSANPTDGDYYKLNSNPYTNQELRANLVVPFSQNIKLKVDPYLWTGQGGGYYSYGAPSKITYGQSLNYTNKYGMTAILDGNVNHVNIEAGTFYEYGDLKNFSDRFKGTNGDTILANLASSFKYWSYIYRTKTSTTMPFIAIKQKNIADMFDYNIGVKYAIVKRDVTSYDTTAINSYYANDDVYNHLGAVNSNASYNKTYTKLLPRAQFGLNIDNNSYAYISYAKTFQVPNNRHLDSNSKNTSTQSVVDNLKAEAADTYNLGYRYTNNSFYVTPGIYYSKYSDKIISVPTQDPTVSNPQNVGSTSVYGLEFESGVNITKSISIYGSYGYAKATYGNDYTYYDAKSNTIKTVHVKSNQLVDTPEHTLSASVTYKKAGFEGTISGKYISSRFGDATNTQKVSGYTIFNVDAKQNFTLMGAKLAASASVHNVFDTKYIGRIATGNTNGYYYAGTPLVATVGLSGKF